MKNKFIELEKTDGDGNILEICDIEIINGVLTLPIGIWKFPDSYDVPMDIMIIGEKVNINKKEPITHKDNWADRATGMVCGTCMFFREKKTDKVQRANHLIGRCKRHAPTMSGFPVVWSDDDGCGDHKLDETKVIVNDNKV